MITRSMAAERAALIAAGGPPSSRDTTITRGPSREWHLCKVIAAGSIALGDLQVHPKDIPSLLQNATGGERVLLQEVINGQRAEAELRKMGIPDGACDDAITTAVEDVWGERKIKDGVDSEHGSEETSGWGSASDCDDEK